MFKKVLVGMACGVLVLQSISCSSKKNEGELAGVGFEHSVVAAEHEHGSKNDPHAGMGAVHGSKNDPHAGMSAVHGSSKDAQFSSGSPDDVIVTVNGEKIFRRDVDRMLDVYKQFVQPEMLPKVRDQIINGLVTQSLLRDFVSSQNIEVKQERMDKELETIKTNLKNNPATANHTLEEVLESQGQTLESFKNKMKTQVALDQLFEKNIDDAQLQDYFQKNTSLFSEETVTASHILVDTRKLTTQQELDEAKGKIEHIKKEIAEGADFAETAKQHSDCPSKEKGGDLGTFPRKGAMVEPFAEAAFKLNVNEISEPIKTDFGYHLIKVTAKNKGKEITFEEVKEKVKTGLKEQKAGELIESLWEKATIEKG